MCAAVPARGRLSTAGPALRPEALLISVSGMQSSEAPASALRCGVPSRRPGGVRLRFDVGVVRPLAFPPPVLVAHAWALMNAAAHPAQQGPHALQG
jgi:hypothetical protein